MNVLQIPADVSECDPKKVYEATRANKNGYPAQYSTTNSADGDRHGNGGLGDNLRLHQKVHKTDIGDAVLIGIITSIV